MIETGLPLLIAPVLESDTGEIHYVKSVRDQQRCTLVLDPTAVGNSLSL